MLDLEPGTLIGLSLLASMLLCLVLVPGCMALARRLGAVDYPRHNLDNPKAVPRLGGVAIFASSLLVLAAASYLVPAGKQTLATLGPKLWGFALGAVMVLVLGLVDDIRGLRARWKLLGEIIIALFVYFWGLRVEVITNPFNPASPLHLGSLEMPLNVLWMVLAMNAMNLIDGMDGLAGGVFLLALVLLLAAGLMGGALRAVAVDGHPAGGHGGLVVVVASGLRDLLFYPCPWQRWPSSDSNLPLRLGVAAQSLAWYLLLPGLAWGLAKTRWQTTPAALAAASWALVVGLAIAVMVVNLGTLYRLRDMVLLPLLPFFSAEPYRKLFSLRPFRPMQ